MSAKDCESSSVKQTPNVEEQGKWTGKIVASGNGSAHPFDLERSYCLEQTGLRHSADPNLLG